MGTKKDREQKREFARMLFLHESLTQKEIAARVGVSEVTISKWSNQDNWESYKVSVTMSKEEQLKNLYRQISEINKAINAKEVGKRFASTAEADTISKLSVAIEKMESDVGIADMVSVSKKFLTFIRKFDLAKAQEIAPLFDAFVKENIK
jgi:transcriptional regulator with XRE-family HTH domain